ncbi:MAG: hypothetical protein HQL13_02410 [Candidatus Omnitrophica bacterium]|nr:hypothetical protein [Candidatus Omnitrophota bacterium]
MSPENANVELLQRIDAVRQARHDLNDELGVIELTLSESIGLVDVVALRVKNKRQETPIVLPPAAGVVTPSAMPPLGQAKEQLPAQAGMTLDEFKTHMSAILQGSLDAVTEKLSDKIAGMLKELKTLSGPAREIKLRELKEAAEFESVDLSSLYVHEKVQSNLEDVGVEEKESKGIDSTLEKLRRLKGLKTKTDGEKG